MGSPSARRRHALALYSGQDALPLLTRYHRLVVQPGQFSAAQVRWLRGRGVQVLASLSLGEDSSGEEHDWITAEPPTIRKTRLVNASHPGWRAQIQAQIRQANTSFSGFFLDALDCAGRDPQQVRAMLKLVRLVRQWVGPQYLLANRGTALLHRLRGTVNGVLIESFSTTWQDGYRVQTRPELDAAAHLLEQVRRLGLEVYALDYANTPYLRRFALRRANAFGLSTFITNGELSLPTGYSPPPTRVRSEVGFGSNSLSR